MAELQGIDVVVEVSAADEDALRVLCEDCGAPGPLLDQHFTGDPLILAIITLTTATINGFTAWLYARAALGKKQKITTEVFVVMVSSHDDALMVAETLERSLQTSPVEISTPRHLRK